MRSRHVSPGPSRTGRSGLVDPMRLDPTGEAGPTTAQARGRAWRRSSRGLYVPFEVDGSVPEQRIVEAAAVLPAYGGVTGWAALRWMGAQWMSGLHADGRPRPVVLVTAGGDNPPPGGHAVGAGRVKT